MIKKIGIVLYVLAVLALTTLLVPIFYTLGSSNFLKYNENIIMESHYNTIIGTTLAYRNDGTSALVKKESLYNESFLKLDFNDNLSYSIDLDFYSLVEYKKQVANNAFALIVTNIYGVDDNIIKDEDGRYIIFLRIDYANPIYVNNKLRDFTEDVFVPLYDLNSGIVIINHDYLKDENNNPVEISKMTLSFGLTNGSLKPLVILNNGVNDDVDIFDLSYNRDISSLSSDNLNVLGKNSLNDLFENSDFIHNDYLTSTFNKKYRYFIPFLIIWITLILIVSYFIFIGKHIINYFKTRKITKKELYEIKKSRIKQSEEDLK